MGATGTICRDHCVQGGAILRAVRDVMIMSPSLTITEAEIDELFRVLRRALDLTAKDVGMA